MPIGDHNLRTRNIHMSTRLNSHVSTCTCVTRLCTCIIHLHTCLNSRLNTHPSPFHPRLEPPLQTLRSRAPPVHEYLPVGHNSRGGRTHECSGFLALHFSQHCLFPQCCVQRQATGLLGCNELRFPSLLDDPTRSALPERRSGVHGYQVEREQQVPAHHVKAQGRERLVRNAPLLFPDEEDSAGMQGQPTDTQRA